MSDDTIKMLSVDNKSVTTNLDRAGYRKMGVHVCASNSYHDAVENLKKKDIDVIVINMDFEEIDAIGITKHLKSDERWKDIMIVVTSVRSNASVRKKALNAGADLFVEQPIPRTFFIEKIKNLLEQQTRTTERVEIHGDVEFEIDEETFTSRIGDLSISGMLIATEMEVGDGTQMNLSFTLPGYKKPLKVRGEVVRTIHYNPNSPNRPTGLGVRFVEFNGDSEKRLSSYIDKTSGKEVEMLYYL
ncbi:MAG: PilZ domain-containing protein [Bdellovibrionota bacterium]